MGGTVLIAWAKNKVRKRRGGSGQKGSKNFRCEKRPAKPQEKDRVRVITKIRFLHIGGERDREKQKRTNHVLGRKNIDDGTLGKK